MTMSPRTKARVLFASALILVFLSGALAFIAISRLVQAQEWVGHTREVQVALSQVNTVVSRAGRTRAQYIDSGDPHHLQDHEGALAQIPTALADLKRLVSDNPSQLNRFAELQKIVEQRLSLMHESVTLKQSGQSTAAAQSALSQNIVSVAGQMDSIIQAMQDQEQDLLEVRSLRLRTGERWAAVFLCSAFAISIVLFILHYRLLNIELEGRQQAEVSLRKLSAHILQIQDEERRKFSRELHDSLGQYLVAAKMNVDMLGRSLPGNNLIADCSHLLQDALTETRTISHLLHPPLLDEAGFASAARWYVDGFAERSGIATRLDIPEHFDRLSDLVEIAMFRILQEGLTNIHRHSRSSQATISVTVGRKTVCLTIGDNGKGISSTVLQRLRSDGTYLGVGLAGMRERIRELGGSLDIRSDLTGTLITATLPKSERLASNDPQQPKQETGA
jgi:signal transduction histidine kinase